MTTPTLEPLDSGDGKLKPTELDIVPDPTEEVEEVISIVAPALHELLEDVKELIIVGSGPAGYTAAIYAARAQLAPLVLEGSVEAGGALMTTTEVENFPGFPESIQGPELMDKLREQAEKFGAELITDDAVGLDLTGPIKTVKQANGVVHRARAVILAMGSGYRKLGISGEFEFSGKGVSWCATCDGFFFRDQHVVVVGGGDSAAEEALFLTKFAAKVTVVHRRSSLRASKIMQRRLLTHPKVDFIWDTEVVGLSGDEKLEKILLKHGPTDTLSELSVDGLFIAIGHDPRSELVRGEVELDAEGYVLKTGATTATNLAGVFACGDLVDHRYRQAITAAGSGCSAAMDAEHYLTTGE